MSEKINNQANPDTAEFRDINEGLSGLVTANSQNQNNVIEKGFSGIVSSNSNNGSENIALNSDQPVETK